MFFRSHIPIVLCMFAAAAPACTSNTGDDEDGPIARRPQKLLGACGQVHLTANREYSPTSWNDASATLPAEMPFAVPDRISVTVGASGNHKAELTLTNASGSTVCTYVGNGPGGHGGETYLFDECDNGVHAGDTYNASGFGLHVVNGDHGRGNQFGKTEVDLVIYQLAGSSCSDNNVCNGVEICNGTGTCVAGTPLAVDDGNECTVDSCDPASGVSNTFIDTAFCRGQRTFDDHALAGLGSNGRSCSDCHMNSDQFQLRPSNVEGRFQEMVTTGIADPLFNPIDADDFAANGASANDFSNLRNNGLIRIHFTLPDNKNLGGAYTTMQVVERTVDPNTGAQVVTLRNEVDVWRAVPSVFDVRDTGPDGVAPDRPAWPRGPNPSGGYQLDARIDTLQNQALGAFVNHAQVPDPSLIPASLLDDLASFQNSLVRPPPAEPLTALELQGKAIFERACTSCHGGAGGSTPVNPGFPTQHYQDISTSCPRPADPAGLNRWNFNNSASAASCQTQTSPPSGVRLGQNVREYLLTYSDGTTRTVFSSDPGRALLTGHIFFAPACGGAPKCGPLNLDDWQKFDMPALKGISKTAPYFHNNSAQTLLDVIIHYEEVYKRAKALNPAAAILWRRVFNPDGTFTDVADRANLPAERDALLAFLNKL